MLWLYMAIHDRNMLGYWLLPPSEGTAAYDTVLKMVPLPLWSKLAIQLSDEQIDCMCWETRQNIAKHVCKRNMQRQHQTNAAQHIVSNPFLSLLHRQIVWISKGCSSCHFLPGFIRLARDWPLTCSNSLGIGQNIRICYWWLLIHWWLLIKMQVAPKSIVAGDGTWRHYKKKTVSDRASLQTLQRFQTSKHHVHWKRTCTSHTTWHYILHRIALTVFKTRLQYLAAHTHTEHHQHVS